MVDMLTQEYLKSLFRYDPETGHFVRLVSRGQSRASRAGVIAGCEINGYIVIGIDGKSYKAHRLAVLYMTGQWPSGHLDHWDLCRSNNRWKNLRPATQSQNGANRACFPNTTSGYKGVYCHKKKRRVWWRARIMLNGKRRSLGLFDTPAEANAAYLRAATELFGQFARAA